MSLRHNSTCPDPHSSTKKTETDWWQFSCILHIESAVCAEVLGLLGKVKRMGTQPTTFHAAYVFFSCFSYWRICPSIFLSLYSSVLLRNNLIWIKTEKAPAFYLINPDTTQKLVLFDNHPTAAADLCMHPYDLCRALQQHCSFDTYNEQPLQHPAPAVQYMFLPSLLFSVVSSHLSFIISKNIDGTTQRHTSHFYPSGIPRLHLTFLKTQDPSATLTP